MGDILATIYPWTKAFHIISVIAWMAGLFYLPRLFVYHAERATVVGEPLDSFRIMEKKLIRLIMNPAMIATWIFGLMLVFTPGIVDWSMIWPWTKATAVLAMTGFHHWLSAQRKIMVTAPAPLPGRTYRMMNEVPTLLLVVIVFSVVLKF